MRENSQRIGYAIFIIYTKCWELNQMSREMFFAEVNALNEKTGK